MGTAVPAGGGAGDGVTGRDDPEDKTGSRTCSEQDGNDHWKAVATMGTLSRRSAAVLAFFAGIGGAIVTAVVVLAIMLWLFGRSFRPVADIAVVLIPLVMPFAWCAVLRGLLPQAPRGAAPSGYASVVALLCIASMPEPTSVALLFLTLISLLLGVIGDAMAASRSSEKPRFRGGPGEPVCPRCGYVLYYAKGFLCPDCGSPFRSADIDMRLARWEDGVLTPVADDKQD